MSALIVRMPEEKRERSKQAAKARNMSVNRLIDEMATVFLADYDAQIRFEVRAARGRGRERRGRALLAKAGRRQQVTHGS